MESNITRSLTTFWLCVFFFSSFAQTWSHNRSVEAIATVNSSAPSITLQWAAAANTLSYQIYKRVNGSENWGNSIATLNPGDLQYTDMSVVKNQIYEYRIIRVCDIVEPLSTTGGNMLAYGFVTAGIEVKTTHHRGELLLLVSENLEGNLQEDLDLLRADLSGDGWNVSMEIIPSSATVTEVKNLVDEYYLSEAGLKALYLLGHIPVPYSGMYCQNPQWPSPPDGHGASDPNSHCGAWPADAYYGIFSDEWTDVNSTSLAKRAENNNHPDDGKFDNIILPDSVKIQVGRVDLSRLAVFTESEADLTKRYIQKSHEYRQAIKTYKRMAIIEDNFSGYTEGFASSAHSDFTAIIGENAFEIADLFTSTDTADYLFSYTCGAGSYTNCNGVGASADFTSRNPAVFNHMFGSFFGDYDIQNSIARASLASQTAGLISLWSGRPKWVTHGLAMGETFGQCAIRTQNCNWDYGTSFYQNQTHINLLGDPSLRVAMFRPPTVVACSSNLNRNHVFLSWEASVDAGVSGYYIYQSTDPYSGYVLLNELPVNGTSFTHYTPDFGTNYYMVRAERLETTGSGTYYNLSQGAFSHIDGILRTASDPVLPKVYDFALYPVPTNDHITIRSTIQSGGTIRIMDALGNLVFESEMKGQSLRIETGELEAGIYFLTFRGATRKFIKI